MNIDELNRCFKQLKDEIEQNNLSLASKALLQDLVDDWHYGELAACLALQAQGAN